MIYTDNKDFYPTPRELFDKLIAGSVRYISGRILEPSAGKGDIIKYIRDINKYRSDDVKIDAIEPDTRLVNQLVADGVSVVWDDFLTYETYKEYDYIIMNPPFSRGVDHVLKAIELAENQISHCEIYAILNRETINNAYSTKRQELLRKLDEYEADIRYVSGAFSSAERRTDVEVALIRVAVSKSDVGQFIYDKIFANTDHMTKISAEDVGGALSTYVKPADLQAKLDDIERLVAEYETACRLVKESYKATREKESFLNYVANVNKREDGRRSDLSYIVSAKRGFNATNMDEELSRLRRAYWELILDTDEFRDMLTSESRQKLNQKIESAGDLEINIPNIRMLLMALSANRRDILIDSVVSIFKKITDRHMAGYSTNIHYYNGWKTNSSYKINKKIVIPIQYEPFTTWDFSENYAKISYKVRDWIGDLIKALQLIDPEVNEEFTAISDREFENEWIRFKMFAKGTIHVWFNDLRLLAKLNYICGSHFGWLPSEDEQRDNPKAREWVAREFGDIGEVKLLREVVV